MDDDGRLDLTKLLTAFRTFFGEHSEHWLGRFAEHPEAGPQLILQAYLHRVVNGGGRLEREYGLGRGRTDLLAPWPREAGPPSELRERFVVECKVLRDSDRKSLAGVIERGVEQTLGYMEKCGAEEGHLVVIDRRTGAEERPRSEGVEDRRGGDGEADGSGRRQDGRGVVVWTLQHLRTEAVIDCIRPASSTEPFGGAPRAPDRGRFFPGGRAPPSRPHRRARPWPPVLVRAHPPPPEQAARPDVAVRPRAGAPALHAWPVPGRHDRGRPRRPGMKPPRPPPRSHALGTLRPRTRPCPADDPRIADECPKMSR